MTQLKQNKSMKLGDVIDIRDGTHDFPKYIEQGIPLVTSKNLTDSGLCFRDVNFISEDNHKEISKRSAVERGDILYGMIGTIGKPTLVDTDRRFSIKNVALFKQSNPNISNRYLFWLLNSQSISNQIAQALRGGTQKFVSLGVLRRLEAIFPTLTEQIRIAAILDQADALRTKRREALAQLDSLTQAIFIEMFGDPVSNPKGWEVKKLKEISKSILSGTTPNGGSQVYVSDGIVFFRSQNVWKNRLLLDDVAYIDNETHLKMRKSSLQNKDILITKTGRINTENSSLGRAAIFIGKDNSANINGHVYLVRLEKGSIHEFVLYVLTTDEYKEYIRSVCVGGIDKRQINKEHLEEFPIISPPLNLQQRFATLVEFIEKKKSLYRAQLAELDALFASLQHRAFRGEL